MSLNAINGSESRPSALPGLGNVTVSDAWQAGEPIRLLSTRITAQITEQGTAGCLVLGNTGSGHAESIRISLNALSATHRVVRLIGTSYGQEVPFGCLLPLLTASMVPVELSVGAVTRKLVALAAAEPTVILVEQAQLLDDSTLAIIAHLASNRHLNLIISTQSLSAVPAELRALHRTGSLELLEPEVLSRAQLDATVTEVVGVRPTCAATEYLFRLSEGYVGWLVYVLDSALRSRTLMNTGDALVLTDSALSPGASMRSMARSVVAGLSTPVRHTLLEAAVLDRALGLEDRAGLEQLLIQNGFLDPAESGQSMARARLELLRACLVPSGTLGVQVVMAELRPESPRKKTLAESRLLTDLRQLQAQTSGIVASGRGRVANYAETAQQCDRLQGLLGNHVGSSQMHAELTLAVVENLLARGDLVGLEGFVRNQQELCPEHLESRELLELLAAMLELAGGQVVAARAILAGLRAQADLLQGARYAEAINVLESALNPEPAANPVRWAGPRLGILGYAADLLALAASEGALVPNRIAGLRRFARTRGYGLLAEAVALAGFLQDGVGSEADKHIAQEPELLYLGHLQLASAQASGEPGRYEQGLATLAQAGLVLHREGVGRGMLGTCTELAGAARKLRRQGTLRSAGTAPSAGHAGTVRAGGLRFPGSENLTKREIQMVQEVSRGGTNADIARRFSISTRTVEGHLYQIYAKLAVPHRRALRRLVSEHGGPTVQVSA